MHSGVEIKLIWMDVHLLEVKVRAWSPTFSGVADVYVGHDCFRRAAETLKGFPGAAGDVRQLDFGTFESTLGAASLRFYCQGSAVHAFVSARIQAERADRNQYAEVMFSVEAAAIDNFVEQLQNVNDEGEVATLVGADVP